MNQSQTETREGKPAPLSRRTFVQGTAAAAISAASYRRVQGANDRVRLGFIGFGLMGKRHLLDFQEQPDAQVVSVAEVHRGRLDEAVALAGGSAVGHSDFRRLLEQPDVDAVVVSTPDHWHALMTMMACTAGKDVYVEKPTTLFVREGRWMVDVAQRTKRVVQVGTQQRSGPHYQKARELIRGGHLGKICAVRMASYRNVRPGFGNPPDQDPPQDFDWEMFLGPAPARKYNPNRGIYHFRWFWDYSGGQMTNLAQHAMDIVHWCLDTPGPLAVTSAGGRYALEDNGETPDTQDTIFEYGDWTATWSHREASQGPRGSSEFDFFGTRGSISVSRTGFTVTPDRKINPTNAVPQFGGPHPVGGPQRVAAANPPEFWTTPLKDASGNTLTQYKLHARNFLDCVKTRELPASDLESGHRVATACHLANLSLRLGRKLRWDADKEQIVGDEEAAGMLARPYRAPWDSELKALGVT